MNTWPSTTEVLHAAGLYGDIARWSDPEAMRRGRLCDAACNLLAMGKQLPESWCIDHPECIPYIDGYRLFRAKHKNPTLIKCAWEVVNKAERYKGHPDQLLMLDSVRALIDIKSGGIPPTTPLQTASYETAMYSMGESRVTRFGLQLPGDGTFKLHSFTDPRDKDEWTILVRAHHIRSKYIAEAA